MILIVILQMGEMCKGGVGIGGESDFKVHQNEDSRG